MDYEFKTTFWSDFTIADHFGADAVEDTFKRAFNEWKDNKVYVTELSMVLNWKMWTWNEKSDTMTKLYCKLWERVDKWCMDNLKGDDLSYYTRTTD